MSLIEKQEHPSRATTAPDCPKSRVDQRDCKCRDCDGCERHHRGLTSLLDFDKQTPASRPESRRSTISIFIGLRRPYPASAAFASIPFAEVRSSCVVAAARRAVVIARCRLCHVLSVLRQPFAPVSVCSQPVASSACTFNLRALTYPPSSTGELLFESPVFPSLNVETSRQARSRGCERTSEERTRPEYHKRSTRTLPLRHHPKVWQPQPKPPIPLPRPPRCPLPRTVKVVFLP